jgi:hypothetical protein
MNGLDDGPGVPEAPRTTLDDLRRARGEGWQWARAQTDECPQCGHHPAAMARDDLGPVLIEQAAAWRAFLLEADDEALRTNPAPGVFSPIQYAAHVRDIQRVYGDRILLMLREDDPVFPQFNPDEDAWNGYNQLDPVALADDPRRAGSSSGRHLGGAAAGRLGAHHDPRRRQ